MFFCKRFNRMNSSLPTAKNKAPIHHQTKRKRIQKDRPFNNHPEVCADPAIAAQDPRKGTVRREPAEDSPVFVGTYSEDPRM